MGRPGRKLTLKTRSSTSWSWLTLWWGKRVEVEVPCCGTCHRRIERQRQLRRWIMVLAIAVAVTIAGSIVGGDWGGFKKLLTMGLAVIVLLPVIGWTVLFPPVIDISAGEKHVDYEFQDEMYAHEFAYLNGTKVKGAKPT
jgi:hypothetical protein